MRPTETHSGTASHAKRAAALTLQVVTFRLQQERYAVPIGQVQEVILCRDIARSFEMPEEIVGIYNLRGAIIPIVDLRRRLGIAGDAPGDQQVLVCRVRDSVVGFIVDEVQQVTKIARSDIRPAPSTLTARAPEHIVGICALPGGLITIIDIAASLGRDAAITEQES